MKEIISKMFALKRQGCKQVGSMNKTAPTEELVLDAYKSTLINTFKTAIDFFELNGIKWFACGGTCLGAVRHQDIIPWDDDIDLFVYRDDYERLFDIRESLEPYGLSMISIEDGYGYYNGYIKIFNNQTTLWELKEYESVVGVYIDVFPIDKSDIGVSECLKIQKEYRDALEKYRRGICKTSIKDLLDLFTHFHWGDLWYRISCKMQFHNRKKEYNNLLESIRKVSFNSHGKHTMCVMGSYWERDHYPSEWFSETIEAPFGDFRVKLPVGYDEYLTQLYGDYMKLPPKEKQVSHHDHYYCNLKEGLTLDEVKERINQGEFIVI